MGTIKGKNYTLKSETVPPPSRRGRQKTKPVTPKVTTGRRWYSLTKATVPNPTYTIRGSYKYAPVIEEFIESGNEASKLTVPGVTGGNNLASTVKNNIKKMGKDHLITAVSRGNEVYLVRK